MSKMTDDEIETLVLVVSFDRDVSASEVGHTLVDGGMTDAKAREHGLRRMLPLIRAKAIWRATAGNFHPTEKGRIASAILMGKDPSLYHAFFDEA